ncbi:conserved hypothetical protein [Segniliparus rotundus DSM 44985]|uniref:Uncharacterized protein n=1 Tax=Segniliparus rotundus (strain ATCC BAA-972 / CDC 1076 / CIP 108378 / DSM 44985 / JCM 13578) TaxID=640132 RepID=D6ZAH5_SEGRD|nr:hypothetical protein [Segniliparus rotundus]ADG96717.1 conserved hypothetical protein [Segniliparus rotundus DSM 44985]
MGADDVEKLRLVLAPVPYDTVWLVLAALLVAAAAGCLVGIFVWTLPVERLRRVPVLREITLRRLKRAFSRSIDATAARHRRGEISSRAAHGSISRGMRVFLQLWTGEPAGKMVLAEFAESPLAGASGALETLYPGQFAPQEQPDVERAAAAAKEVIAGWR